MKIANEAAFLLAQFHANDAMAHYCALQWDLSMQLLRKAYGFEVKK